jgi:hypothetical protein
MILESWTWKTAQMKKAVKMSTKRLMISNSNKTNLKRQRINRKRMRICSKIKRPRRCFSSMKINE